MKSDNNNKLDSSSIHVIVHDHPSPDRGGVENMAYSIALALKAEGEDVAVTGINTVLNQCFPVSSGILRIPLERPVRSKYFSDFRVACLLLKLNRQFGERMILHLLIFRNVKVYRWLKWLMRGRCISYFHGNEVVRLARKTPKALVKNIALCDLIICNSAYTLTWTHKLGQFPNIKILHPSIKLPSSVPTKEEARKHFNVGSKNILWIMIGRFVWRKGHLSVIEAVKQLLPRYPNLYLVIAGEGSMQAAIKAAIAAGDFDDHVRLLGKIEEYEKWMLFTAADFALMPSLIDENRNEVEGFGIANIEAAAMGAIPVGTLTGGVPEALDFGQAGILLPACDSNALPNAIATHLIPYLDSPKQLEPLRAHATERARKDFSWSSYVQKVLEACEEFN